MKIKSAYLAVIIFTSIHVLPVRNCHAGTSLTKILTNNLEQFLPGATQIDNFIIRTTFEGIIPQLFAAAAGGAFGRYSELDRKFFAIAYSDIRAMHKTYGTELHYPSQWDVELHSSLEENSVIMHHFLVEVTSMAITNTLDILNVMIENNNGRKIPDTAPTLAYIGIIDSMVRCLIEMSRINEGKNRAGIMIPTQDNQKVKANPFESMMLASQLMVNSVLPDHIDQTGHAIAMQDHHVWAIAHPDWIPDTYKAMKERIAGANADVRVHVQAYLEGKDDPLGKAFMQSYQALSALVFHFVTTYANGIYADDCKILFDLLRKFGIEFGPQKDRDITLEQWLLQEKLILSAEGGSAISDAH